MEQTKAIGFGARVIVCVCPAEPNHRAGVEEERKKSKKTYLPPVWCEKYESTLLRVSIGLSGMKGTSHLTPAEVKKKQIYQ